LLTAWSVAGVLGPVLVNYIRQAQIDHGVPKAQAYSVTMYIMCGVLLVGLICNVLMRPVEEVSLSRGQCRAVGICKERIMSVRFVVLWLIVGVPLLWGVYNTLQNAMKLFQ
jgi:hypothetical protein